MAGTLNSNASAYTPLLPAPDARPTPSRRSPPTRRLCRRACSAKSPASPSARRPRSRRPKHQSGADSATNPACPAASLIGHTYTGYGVGSTLSYAPGTLYLAGPYHGSPLSVVAIDSAKVGPFDLGTVVIRSAIRIDRQTAQVAIDSAGSDPIPHILDGFPLRLRDIRIYIDRPELHGQPDLLRPLRGHLDPDRRGRALLRSRR